MVYHACLLGDGYSASFITVKSCKTKNDDSLGDSAVKSSSISLLSNILVLLDISASSCKSTV